MDAEDRCLRIAATRHWVISRSQALDAGMSPKAIQRRVANGRWRSIYPGTLFLGAGRPPWEAKLVAACHWAGADTVVSHRAAFELHGLATQRHDQVCLTLPRKKNPRDDIELHFDPYLLETKRVKVGCIPVTTIERTIIDLCRHSDRTEAKRIVELALRKERTNLVRLSRALEAHRSRLPRGGVNLRWVLEHHFSEGVTDSHAEDLFLKIARKAGLRPVHHHVVRKDGRHLAELDFAFLPEKVNVEVDGDAFHRDAVTRERDRRRDAELARLGWAVLRFGYHQLVDEPGWVVRSVQEVLSLRRNALFSQ